MEQATQKPLNQDQAIKYFLHSYLDQPEDSKKILDILEELSEYFQADRSYIFESDTQCTSFNNTHEWCRDGMSLRPHTLQNISAAELEDWTEMIKEKGEVYLSSPFTCHFIEYSGKGGML